MPAHERISAVVSITLFGLALYFVLDFPAQLTDLNLLGSPLSINAPLRWLMILMLGGVAMAGMDGIVRALLPSSGRRWGYIATFWPLPGLLVVLATQTLGLAASSTIWGASLIVVGVLLWLTIAAEISLLTPGELWPHLWRQFIGYAIALIFFIVIYYARSRSAISATSIALVAGLTALSLLRQPPEQVQKSWLLAGVVGLGLGQLTWALNYWRVGALNAGLLLFLVFYLLIGVAQQHLQGTLSRRSLWEFGAVTAVALLVIGVV
jgi:hypothetical protein